MGKRKPNQLVQNASPLAGPSPSPFGQLQHAPAQEQVSPAVRCAENVVLLELLDPVPKPPMTPWFSQDRHSNVGRTLTMDQESKLATNLAFLAGISDNPNYIMAVCVEELPRVGGCQVLIAINKNLPTDGDDILNKVQRGFRQISGRLREVSSETKAVIEEAVFNDIVALCSEKILSRLRSKKSNTSSSRHKTRFIGLVLQEFIRSPWQSRVNMSSPRMTSIDLKGYRRRLETLSAALDDFEAADFVRHEDLSRLVGHIAQLTEAVPLVELLEVVTNQDMNPNSKDRLLDCLLKITRYRQCARFLCQKAEKLPKLRNIDVQKVQYAARAEGDPLGSLTTVDFEQSLRRFQHGGQPIQISTLPGWLTKAAMSCRDSFPDGINKIRREAKVHAEVQILVHYDNVSDEVVPPRILASSKDACYLCHSLIKLHGKFEVRKSHGRLYKGWCLPAAYQEGPLQRSFNSFLERQISATLQSLMELPRRPLMKFSNESTIFPINLSASTLAGPQSSHASSALRHEVTALARAAGDDATGSKVDQQTSGFECTQESHVEQMETHNVEDGVNAQRDIAIDASVGESGGGDTYDIWDGGVDQATDNDSGNNDMKDISDDSMSSELMPGRMLKSGQTVTFEPVPDSRTCFRTNRINLFIDDWSDRFSFRWLSGSEAEGVLRADRDAVLDVDSISPGVDVTLMKDAEGHAYFACGREIVMIHALDTPDCSL